MAKPKKTGKTSPRMDNHQDDERVNYLASLVNNISDALISTDINFHILEWNAAAEEMYGWRAEEVIGRLLQELVQSEYVETTREQIIQTVLEKGTWKGEVNQKRRDGTRIPVMASVSLVKDKAGKPFGFITINSNIMERKQSEEKLQRQNERLKILREIDTAILAADSLENIVGAALGHIRKLVGCRRAALTLFDWAANEAEIFAVRDERETSVPKGTRLQMALFQDLGEILSKNQLVLVNELAELPNPPPQFQILLKEGMHSACILPLYSQGKLTGTFGMFSETRDFFSEEEISLGREVANQVAIAISQKELIEDLRILNAELEQRVAKRTEELKLTNIKLEHANRAKSDFLATMSHELRTPLNSILGLSESLLEQRRGPLNDHQQKSLQTIEASGQHLLNVINDILEVSKIEAGKLSIHPDRISVKEVCESSLNFVRELAFKKAVSLEFQSDPSVHSVYADPQRLKQILVNLLNNAVKFTSENEKVSLEVYPNVERDQIHFSITDKGVGIAPDDLKKLFTPFTQLDSSLAREHAGTGLGLVLVYKMTELHGGSVQVESEVGKGSRFTIVLPWNERETPEQFTSKNISAPMDVVQKPVSISEDLGVLLLVDDNDTNIMVVDDYLQGNGYKVVVAHNGLEALEKAEATSPDMILMDIQMPEMDGLEAIRRLRANPRFSSTPIIALTALAMPGDRERCLSTGANEYMSKPVSLKVLLHTITRLLE
jgi:PAS domain S-box-containing protein